MLNQKREQFLQRQAQVQARNAADAAVRAKSTAGKAPAGSGAAAAQRPGGSTPFGTANLQRNNWLQDSDKYQHILEVRRMPVGAQIKRVIDLLEQDRKPRTAEEIGEATLVDIDGSPELQSSLRSNPKIRFEDHHYSYKPKYELKGRDGLLHLIRAHKDGIPLSEVKDSYLTVAADVQALRTAGQVWVLQNTDTSDEILYPDDPRIQIKVDEDIKQLVRGIKLPDFTDIEKELRRAGMGPATSAARRAALLVQTQQNKDRPKVKKRRDSKRAKYTNSHLPELLQGIEMPPGM